MKQSRLPAALVLWLFPVVAVALVAVLIVGIVALGQALDIGTTLLGRLIVGPIIIAIAFGAWTAYKNRPEPEEGVELTEADHPALWAEVRTLATAAQTAPPARIVMTPEVNAAVTEAAGQRELVLGLPLLSTFSVGELRSVLAHELGHYVGGDTAASAKSLRRLDFLDQVRARVGVLWRWFFTAYAYLYARAAAPASRAAELRADELSVQAAGAEAAHSAMRATVRTALAWDLLNEHYVSLFDLAGRRAPLGMALREIIAANPTIEEATDEIIAEEQPHPLDTHPPLRERIARFAAMGATTPRAGHDAPATSLLTGGDAWVAEAEGALFAQDRPLTTWDEVISAGVKESVDADTEGVGRNIRRMERGSGNLDSILALLDDKDRGPVDLIGGDGPDARDESISTLMTALASGLLGAGAAKVEPRWDRGSGARIPNAYTSG